MGLACSDCDGYQEELTTMIVVSKDNFSPVQPNPGMFQQIQALANHQIPQTFQTYQFYRKAPDTFFIGSLEEDNLENNFGILYKPGQTFFYGQFSNKSIHGKGYLKLIRQNLIFKGEFNQGKPNGQGQLQDSSRNFRFNGIWKGSIRPFSGFLQLYQNKTIKEINFINFQHGDAQIYYRNGSVFKGFIDKKTFLPHGSGKMTYFSGHYYEGEWANGKFQGLGTYVWKTGEKYNGQYAQGLRNGNGDFYYISGKYFKGTWKNGKKEGFGKILDQDGKLIQKGIYHNDIFDPVDSENFEKNSNAIIPLVEQKQQLADKQGKDKVSLEKKESTNQMQHNP